jgi:threonine/homoserine/homoserine lactone efflux protein
MFDSSHLPLFVLASVAVLLIPGPDVLYVIARSMNQGCKAGLVSVLGVEMGTLAHVAAASLSISAIALSSASAFNAIKYLGAAYLVCLGIRTSLERGPLAESTVKTSTSLRRVFGQGVLVAMLNPKTVLFFLAFFPQFVDSTRGKRRRKPWCWG